MLNFISFLIIIIASVFCIKSNIIPNQLLGMGSLILIAYILSLMSGFLKLPSVAGYILAGIIAGYHGLGLVSSTFMKEMTLIESIFIMILISNGVRFVFSEEFLKPCLKYYIIGALSSLLTFLLALGFFAPLTIPLQAKIIMGLFSATFSPLMIYALTGNNASEKSYIQLSLGGYFGAVVLWGILTAFLGVSTTGKIKLASMPLFITVTSTIAGFIWGFLGEKLLYNASNKVKSLYPLAIMFLAYPFMDTFGFDFLFLAVGIGMYNGMFVQREKTSIENSSISALIIFGLFGMHMSLDNALVLGKLNWSLVAIFVSFYVCSRIISTLITLHFISHEPKKFPSILLMIPCGPMALILLQRFIPGFYPSLAGETDTAGIYAVITTSIMIIYIFFSILYALFLPSEETASTSE